MGNRGGSSLIPDPWSLILDPLSLIPDPWILKQNGQASQGQGGGSSSSSQQSFNTQSGVGGQRYNFDWSSKLCYHLIQSHNCINNQPINQCTMNHCIIAVPSLYVSSINVPSINQSMYHQSINQWNIHQSILAASHWFLLERCLQSGEEGEQRIKNYETKPTEDAKKSKSNFFQTIS